MAIIYKVINEIDNKIYIGQTKTKLNQRKISHKWRMKEGVKTHFYNALRKYGWNNFQWSVLCEEEYDKKRINKLEKYYIYFYDSFNNGYNMTIGGFKNFITDEIRKKLSDAQKRRFEKPEERAKISKLHKGKTLTLEHRKKCSEKLKGKNNPNYKHGDYVIENKFEIQNGI